jgi:hypothetical protein
MLFGFCSMTLTPALPSVHIRSYKNCYVLVVTCNTYYVDGGKISMIRYTKRHVTVLEYADMFMVGTSLLRNINVKCFLVSYFVRSS